MQLRITSGLLGRVLGGALNRAKSQQSDEREVWLEEHETDADADSYQPSNEALTESNTAPYSQADKAAIEVPLSRAESVAQRLAVLRSYMPKGGLIARPTGAAEDAALRDASTKTNSSIGAGEPTGAHGSSNGYVSPHGSSNGKARAKRRSRANGDGQVDEAGAAPAPQTPLSESMTELLARLDGQVGLIRSLQPGSQGSEDAAL